MEPVAGNSLALLPGGAVQVFHFGQCGICSGVGFGFCWHSVVAVCLVGASWWNIK